MWSPPSGIMLHTAGLGFLVGADIYDCVVIINTEDALQAFMKIRCTLGGEVSAVAGPVGMGGVLETEVHKRQAPVWNYLKSRGFYAGVQIDGTVIIERTDENERFYGERIGVADILSGKARNPPKEIAGLINTLKAAQGDTDIDESVLPSSEPIPSDYEFKEDTFGLPKKDDDDPFGVKALEEQGIGIREAGTRQRPSMEVFNFSPSPKSPIYNTFHSRKNSKRDSLPISIASTTRTDMATQTDDLPSPRFTDSPHAESPTSTRHDSPVKKTSENLAEEMEESSSSQDEAIEPVKTQRISQISQAGATIVGPAKLKVVTIPKRVPPALPPRSPYRTSRESALSSSPPQLPPRRSGDPTHGLGISTSEDVGTQSLYPTTTQDTIPDIERDIVEEKLEEIHTAPSRDSRRLSPHRDGREDVASVSGSEYSRRTSRAETPAMSRVVSHDGKGEQLETPILHQGGEEVKANHQEHQPITLRDADETQEKPVDLQTTAAAEDTPVMPGGADWDAEPLSKHTPAPEPALALEQHSPSQKPTAVEEESKAEASTLQNIRSSLSADDEDRPTSPQQTVEPTVPAEPKIEEPSTPVSSTLQNIRTSLQIDDDDDDVTSTPPTQNAAEDDFHSVPQTPIHDKAPSLPSEEIKEVPATTKDENLGKDEKKEDTKEDTKTENTKPEASKEKSEFERKRAMFS